MDKKRENKKVQYSKLLPLFTGIIFACCLLKVFTMDFSSYVDLTAYATAITVSGSIFGTTIVWYMKKAQVENNVKLKIELYKTAFQEQLKYREQMFIIKNKYLLNNEEFAEMEMNNPLSGLGEEIYMSIEDTINASQCEAESTVEIQNY